MTVLLTLVTICYFFLVAYCAYCATIELDKIVLNMLSDTRKNLNGLDQNIKALAQELKCLQDEALEMFTLYEITKEITANFSEADAFEFFKNKLRSHVIFQECHYLDSGSPDIQDLRHQEDYLLFPLKSKRKQIGFLAVKGILEADKEKVMILSNQYALALRRVRLYKEIERVAITDSLTGVHTRRYILERLQEELKRSQARKINMSFMMLDVDHFKKFNDRYGHITGDQILREIGNLIKSNIREIDIAGRYGGEEFCVILPDTDREGARYAAERIRMATEEAVIKAYDLTVKVTVSIGTSTSPVDAQKSPALIDKADWALYRAKKSGRNKICSFDVYEGGEEDAPENKSE